MEAYGCLQFVHSDIDLCSNIAQIARKIYSDNYCWLNSGDHSPMYGWRDIDDDKRIAFRMVFLPEEQQGCPGNCAAHFLVAGKEELSSVKLINAFESQLWWSGQDSTENAILISLPDCEKECVEGDAFDEAVELLAIILEGNYPFYSQQNSNLVIAALLRISKIFPMLVNTITLSLNENTVSSKSKIRTTNCVLADAVPQAISDPTVHSNFRELAKYALENETKSSVLANSLKGVHEEEVVETTVSRLRLFNNLEKGILLEDQALYEAFSIEDLPQTLIEFDRARKWLAGNLATNKGRLFFRLFGSNEIPYSESFLLELYNDYFDSLKPRKKISKSEWLVLSTLRDKAYPRICRKM